MKYSEAKSRQYCLGMFYGTYEDELVKSRGGLLQKALARVLGEGSR